MMTRPTEAIERLRLSRPWISDHGNEMHTVAENTRSDILSYLNAMELELERLRALTSNMHAAVPQSNGKKE